MKQTNSPGSQVAWPAMGFALACLCLDSRARALADGWRADLTLGTRFDEASVAGASEGTWASSVMPGVVFRSQTSQADWNFAARRRFDSVGDQRSPRPASDVVSLSGLASPGTNLAFGVDGRYDRTRDLVAQDPRVTASADLTETGWGDARASMWRGEADYQVRARTHVSAALTDGWSQSASMALFPLRTQAGIWLVRGGYQEWTLNDTRVLSAVTGTAGFRRVHTPLLSSEAEAGMVDVRKQGANDESQVAWAATVTGLARAVGFPLDSRLRVSRDVATRGRAEIGRSVAGFGLAARWERSLEAGGGSFTVPAVRDFGSLSVDDSLALGAVVSLEGSYGRARPRDGSGPTVRTARVSGSLVRRMSPWFSGRATYAYLRQEETGSSAFHRGRVEVAVTGSWR